MLTTLVEFAAVYLVIIILCNILIFDHGRILYTLAFTYNRVVDLSIMSIATAFC